MSDAATTEPVHNIWKGVECANGLGANGLAQELAWLAANPGKTIRDGMSGVGRMAWGALCFKLWSSLTREQRLAFIAEAYKTHPAGE